MHLPLILHPWRWSCFILENYLMKKGLLMLSSLFLFSHSISPLWTKIESRSLRAGLTFYLQAHHHQIKLKSRVPLTEEPPCWQLFKQTCPIFIIITLGAKKKKGKKGKSHIHHWIGSLSPWVPSVMSGMLPLCYLLMKKGTENVSATFCSDTSLKMGGEGWRE